MNTSVESLDWNLCTIKGIRASISSQSANWLSAYPPFYISHVVNPFCEHIEDLVSTFLLLDILLEE